MNIFYVTLFCIFIFSNANSTEKPKNNAIDSSTIKLDYYKYNSNKFTKDSVVALVSRAYEFGQGNDKFCSPEVSLTNLGGIGIRIVVISIYFKKNSTTVGSTITRMSIDPYDSTTRGFYQLNSRNCDDITGEARVDVCILRNGKDCSSDVIFADSGKIPLQRILNN